MRLYKLESPSVNQPTDVAPGQSLCVAMIVAAPSESEARAIALQNASGEGRRPWQRATILQIGETLPGMMRGIYMQSIAAVAVPAGKS